MQKTPDAKTPYDFIPSGLVKEDLIVGRGPVAHAGHDVVVHYVGRLESGQQFDSSRARHDPLDFALGAADVIKGLDEGVQGMRVGGLRKLTIRRRSRARRARLRRRHPAACHAGLRRRAARSPAKRLGGSFFMPLAEAMAWSCLAFTCS